ncbi:hypothetical protein KC343_g21515, partial [Hortaea werneckii]
MAYNSRGYNPDALPAHAEPEQAAQMLNNRPGSGGPPPRNHSNPTPANYNKPVPPPPQQNYGRPPPPQAAYGSQPPPSSYGSSGPPPPQQGGYDSYGRQTPAQRYDQYGQQPQSPRWGSQGGYGQAPPPPRNPLTSPPPPANYGHGPPPQGYHNRPPIPEQQRPPTTAPPPPRDGNDRDGLWPLFLQVDKDRSGQLSEEELRRALVNGDYTAFDPHTVKMMIRMFDTDRSGTIN